MGVAGSLLRGLLIVLAVIAGAVVGLTLVVVALIAGPWS
jgi:hypothetical protein